MVYDHQDKTTETKTQLCKYEHFITDWGQNSTGAKWHFCPDCSAGTGANFPLPMCSRRLCV